MSIEPIRQVFQSMPAPRPVACDLVKYAARIDPEEGPIPEFWTIRLYRDDLNGMSGEDQVAIAHWVFDVIKACRKVQEYVYHEVLDREPV